ncbi:MAG: phosphopentomutase [Clostridiales bacterium]|nr:phosphopentomutase [Clostridiales bacterium]MCF8021208.1 phosphopentomutase [Clostridiales bacterium]
MHYKVNRVTLIVLDSVGIGEMPDACDFGDTGSNTLCNTARAVGGLKVPHLAELGLGNISEILGVERERNPSAAYGKMAEKSTGKDTTSGHWEISGFILDSPFPVYPGGFPEQIIKGFQDKTGLQVLGNKAASGTKIIEELGEEHLKTGRPIVYTSADSVFQIAAHEEIISPAELYSICKIAREILKGEHAVGRVIARPFIGEPGSFKRTSNRQDFSLKPPVPTVLDKLIMKGYEVMAVGKIEDIFAGQGISRSVHTKDNMDGVDQTLKYMQEQDTSGLIFCNLVDFDSKFGHRNDPGGYANALHEFDNRLPEILKHLRDDEILIITADHGCDPTTESTDHSREYVPLLVCGNPVVPGVDLGIRESFTDIAAAVAEFFDLEVEYGTSFVSEIIKP